uniref:Uncharacterized protein n=1 Tax=Ixodes ricinus TaxID=34613 RepID=V5ICX1_IXORI
MLSRGMVIQSIGFTGHLQVVPLLLLLIDYCILKKEIDHGSSRDSHSGEEYRAVCSLLVHCVFLNKICRPTHESWTWQA